MTKEEAILFGKECLALAKYEKNQMAIEFYGMVISAFEQEQEWVPVSKRLPEENETVIASTEYGVYPEAKYTKEYGWEWAYEAGADYWRELANVTAWMPLPKRYEPQESEV